MGRETLRATPAPALCWLPASGNGRTHQFALGAPLPGFDHQLQEVHVQDTDII